MQSELVGYLFEGPQNYLGAKDVIKLHQPIVKAKGLNRSHYHAFAGHLEAAMRWVEP